MILGTAAYMSPEQARGKPVDKRADIWAFGVVLYEMLTGRRAFDGEDVSTMLAAVIQTEPRLGRLPSRMQRLIKRCLEKDPKQRLRDIGDAWKLLDEATPAPARSPTQKPGGWPQRFWRRLLGARSLGAVAQSRSPCRSTVDSLEVDLGSDVSLEPLLTPTPSTVLISPDGTRLVYSASVSGGPPAALHAAPGSA